MRVIERALRCAILVAIRKLSGIISPFDVNVLATEGVVLDVARCVVGIRFDETVVFAESDGMPDQGGEFGRRLKSQAFGNATA